MLRRRGHGRDISITKSTELAKKEKIKMMKTTKKRACLARQTRKKKCAAINKIIVRRCSSQRDYICPKQHSQPIGRHTALHGLTLGLLLLLDEAGSVVASPPSLELFEADVTVVIFIHDDHRSFHLRGPKLGSKRLGISTSKSSSRE